MFVANIYICIYIFILFVNTTKIQNIDNHSTTKTQHLWQSQTQKTLSWIRRRKVFANLASTSSPPSALLSLLSPPFLSAPLVIARTPRDSHQPLQMLQEKYFHPHLHGLYFQLCFPGFVSCLMTISQCKIHQSEHDSPYIWSHYYDYDHDDYLISFGPIIMIMIIMIILFHLIPLLLWLWSLWLSQCQEIYESLTVIGYFCFLSKQLDPIGKLLMFSF